MDFCTYKIAELRKPPLEIKQDKGFKTKGSNYLFPARGRKLVASGGEDGHVEFQLPIPRKGTETKTAALI